MKFVKAIIVFIFLCLGFCGYSQINLTSVIELSVDHGLSNDLADGNRFSSFNGSGDILVSNRRLARTRNISVGYTILLNSKNGFKISFGYATYGFDYKGIFINSQNPINDLYRKTFLEWGVSYVYKIPVFPTARLIIEPGIRYHSNGNPTSNAIVFADKDSFSISNYTGFEIPMMGNNFFVTVGLQLKIPLQRYNFGFNENEGYYPYFIGLKIGVNYQF